MAVSATRKKISGFNWVGYYLDVTGGQKNMFTCMPDKETFRHFSVT